MLQVVYDFDVAENSIYSVILLAVNTNGEMNVSSVLIGKCLN